MPNRVGLSVASYLSIPIDAVVVVVVVAIRRLNFVDKRFDGLLFEHRTASKLESKPLSRRSIALDNSEAVDCYHLFEL